MTISLSGMGLFCKFGTCKEHFCKIILNLNHLLDTTCDSKIFSSFLALVCGEEPFSIFGAEPSEKQFCKIILKSIHLLKRSGLFKFVFLFLALAAIYFCEVKPFKQFCTGPKEEHPFFS